MRTCYWQPLFNSMLCELVLSSSAATSEQARKLYYAINRQDLARLLTDPSHPVSDASRQAFEQLMNFVDANTPTERINALILDLSHISPEKVRAKLKQVGPTRHFCCQKVVFSPTAEYWKRVGL